jgi:two-component system OmpR family sensor kinase
MRIPLLLALLGLAGAVAATLFLHRAAESALDRVLDERLRAAGESAALLLGEPQPGSQRLRALMNANALDGAYLLDPQLVIVEDATGPAGRKADLLRVDPERVRRAFSGQESVAPTWQIGELSVATGYFHVGGGRLVLALEAGEEFVKPRKALSRARNAALLLSLIAAVSLGLLAARWNRTAQQAARAETASRMAAMAAHEIRNPLGVMRGTVELMRERMGASASERDREALQDLLQEIERLRGLTEDFLDLGRDRPLSMAPLDARALLEEAASAAERSFPSVRVRRDFGSLPALTADAGRLRQVFGNLLANAAQAQVAGEITLSAVAEAGRIRVRVQDFGPGVPGDLRLFDPFETRKQGGTGLGLYVAKRLVERHGGTLRLAGGPPGAVFEVSLPAEGA